MTQSEKDKKRKKMNSLNFQCYVNGIKVIEPWEIARDMYKNNKTEINEYVHKINYKKNKLVNWWNIKKLSKIIFGKNKKQRKKLEEKIWNEIRKKNAFFLLRRFIEDIVEEELLEDVK